MISAALAAAVSVYAASPSATDSISVRQLSEVVVTGSNEAIPARLLPYTVSVVSGSNIEATGDTKVLSAISGMVPSLFVTQRNIFGFGVSNGGAGHIKMRGVGGDRASGVLMMVDGQPQFAGLYSHHVADTYNADYVERVEVLRGPASVLYGSNAMAGVINVITRGPKEDGVLTTLTTQYGSYNTWLSTLSNTVRYGKFSSLISLSHDYTDGLRNDFDFRQENVYAKMGYDLSSFWKASADYSFSAINAHDPVYPSLQGKEGIYHQRVYRQEVSLMATDSYDNFNGAIRLYYSFGNHFIHDPNYFHSTDDRLGVIAYQNFSPWTDAAATIGFDFDRYTGKIPVSGGKPIAENPMATMARRSITEYSPYLTLSQTLWKERIVLNGGLRMANSDMFGTQWVPQGGFTLLPLPTWSLKASVARGYRNPSFRELYLYKFANPDLKPEKMMNYEVSIAKTFGRWLALDITGYYAKGTDLIQQTSVRNENTGRFINKGIEISAQSHLLSCLHINATYSYLHSSVASLSALTGAPKNQYFLGVGWDAWKGLHVDADLKGVGGLYVAYDVEHQNYALLHLRLSYKFPKYVRIFVDLDNITDAQYIINKGYPMPGFTAMGGISFTI